MMNNRPCADIRMPATGATTLGGAGACSARCIAGVTAFRIGAGTGVDAVRCCFSHPAMASSINFVVRPKLLAAAAPEDIQVDLSAVLADAPTEDLKSTAIVLGPAMPSGGNSASRR
eukprot:TRINITY_DN17536_c0_g1_i1.p2 TRINITY_DN17536_c0_g1~~TRINITY_DN17536_c0_g1_i1.p2  ORF type:complete len:116 (-),score=7.67 TRINITY_DN17536_c0_g1_i1:128-475(-)